MIRLVLAAALLAVPARPLRAADAGAAGYTLETGVINGAQFSIARPTGDWNRSVLLLAHGSRPAGAPLLADLHPERASNRALLADGWIVATTSYRRTGIVVADAIADLDALRAYIADAYGEPGRVILSGDSVGGLVVTIMAERDAGPYQGAVVFDPTLYISEANSTAGLTLLPRIPLLLVATERESAQAKAYVTALVSRPAPVVQPVLFLISREGHANINQMERLGSIQALTAWIERGPEVLPAPAENQRFFNATVKADPGPSRAVRHARGRGFDTRVVEVDPVYGTVLLEAQAGDFEAAGVEVMTYFRMVAQGHPYRVLYGRNYGDVKADNWVAFPDADGRTDLALTQGNAAAVAGLQAGDRVSVDAQPRDGAPASN